MAKCKITFHPWKKTISVEQGTKLLDAAVAAGVHVYNSCGGDGACGRCKVIVKSGGVFTEPGGRLTGDEKKNGYVLACRTTCKEDMEVEVPPESRIEAVSILTGDAPDKRPASIYKPTEEVLKKPEMKKDAVCSHSPLSSKVYLELPPPTLEDNISDTDRLYRGIRDGRDISGIHMGLDNIRILGKLLRASNWKLTVTLGSRNENCEVILVETGDTTDRNYGIALDIGTSTIVSYLIDLNNEKVISTKASFNPQIDFGEDVISRIIYAREEQGLEKLHQVVVDTINSLILSHAEEGKISLNSIQSIACAGNTTMVHLLLKIAPDFIRKEPYIPSANHIPVIRASEIGIRINPGSLLSCAPGVASYVGGDIIAGVLASGIYDSSKLSLFIDLGTNGEAALGNNEWLLSCSTSAGPCFEGGGIKCGIRAMKGAIEEVKIDSEKAGVAYKTIGGAKPRGICGAGLIQLIGELLEKGVLDKSGKFTKEGADRVKSSEDGMEFLVVKGAETESGQDIVITEADIKNTMNSKGAIYSGCEVLLKRVELGFNNLDRVIIAGGLGNALDIEKAIMIGLLPDIPLEKYVFVGNSSIAGAKLMLLYREAVKKAAEIANKMTYVELSVDPDFMNNYTASLFFPHTNIDLFPSVKY